MHEYSIVSSLLARVQRETDRHPNAIVRTLHLRIGERAGVEVELLRTAFESCRVHTPCEAAELEISEIAMLWRCPKCGGCVALRCPHCQVPARLIAGDEIMLDRIELEVPDV
jgi:hydrogenase nickel insertion protein HypA